MRRSELETYVDILCLLSDNGPLKLNHIKCDANLDCSILREYLSFLAEQGLVEERTALKNRTVYVVTQRGLSVLRYFRRTKQAIQIIQEDKTGATQLF